MLSTVRHPRIERRNWSQNGSHDRNHVRIRMHLHQTIHVNARTTHVKRRFFVVETHHVYRYLCGYVAGKFVLYRVGVSV